MPFKVSREIRISEIVTISLVVFAIIAAWFAAQGQIKGNTKDISRNAKDIGGNTAAISSLLVVIEELKDDSADLRIKSAEHDAYLRGLEAGRAGDK